MIMLKVESFCSKKYRQTLLSPTKQSTDSRQARLARQSYSRGGVAGAGEARSEGKIFIQIGYANKLRASHTHTDTHARTGTHMQAGRQKGEEGGRLWHEAVYVARHEFATLAPATQQDIMKFPSFGTR